MTSPYWTVAFWAVVSTLFSTNGPNVSPTVALTVWSSTTSSTFWSSTILLRTISVTS
jgi:hypothetical protein